MHFGSRQNALSINTLFLKDCLISLCMHAPPEINASSQNAQLLGHHSFIQNTFICSLTSVININSFFNYFSCRNKSHYGIMNLLNKEAVKLL